MVVKKAGGKIYGAVLTSAEKKAMNMEIERQLAEYTRKHEVELNAMILYVLHEQLGFLVNSGCGSSSTGSRWRLTRWSNTTRWTMRTPSGSAPESCLIWAST